MTRERDAYYICRWGGGLHKLILKQWNKSRRLLPFQGSNVNRGEDCSFIWGGGGGGGGGGGMHIILH